MLALLSAPNKIPALSFVSLSDYRRGDVVAMTLYCWARSCGFDTRPRQPRYDKGKIQKKMIMYLNLGAF